MPRLNGALAPLAPLKFATIIIPPSLKPFKIIICNENGGIIRVKTFKGNRQGYKFLRADGDALIPKEISIDRPQKGTEKEKEAEEPISRARN